MTLVLIFVGAIAVLLLVTRLAARREAARKAQLAHRARREDGDGPPGE